MTVPFAATTATFAAPVRVQSLEYTGTEVDHYVSFPGDESIDRILPWGMLALFVGFLIESVHAGYVAVLAANTTSARAYGLVMGFLIGRAAIQKYANSHSGQYPLRISTLVDDGLLMSVDRAPQFGGSWMYHGIGSWPAAPHFVVAYDTNNSDGKRTCLFGDGHVETIDMADWGSVFQESSKSRRTGH